MLISSAGPRSSERSICVQVHHRQWRSHHSRLRFSRRISKSFKNVLCSDYQTIVRRGLSPRFTWMVNYAIWPSLEVLTCYKVPWTAPHTQRGSQRYAASWCRNLYHALNRSQGLTINPAYASFTEDILGSLEIGKLADFVVLSHDIMSIPANEILNTQVLATVVDGELVYGSMPGAAK